MVYAYSVTILVEARRSDKTCLPPLVHTVFMLFESLKYVAPLRPVNFLVPCGDTATCKRVFQLGSVCSADGYCTNRFASGCLRHILGSNDAGKQTALPMRACNSDDGWIGDTIGEDAGSLQCSVSDFDYPEVRIGVGDWGSSMMISWILQILLYKLLGVPSTIETGLPVRKGGRSSFYDPENDISYGRKVYKWEGLETAHNVLYGTCNTMPHSNCHHITPEVWPRKVSF